MKFLQRLMPLLACSLILPLNLRAETVTDHPALEVVRGYIRAIVKQDWKTSSEMLLPSSLEYRKRQIVEMIKRSRTINEEVAGLSRLGLKDVRELEKMTPQEVYIADRKAVHDLMNIPPDVIKRKQDTLKINILGVVQEEGGKTVHALVRTVQETLDTGIEELLLISLVQDPEFPKKWLIAPDMQNPVTKPLAKTGESTEKSPSSGKK